MLDILEIIATFSATLFSGAAIYINAVEHPARMGLETRNAALQWAPSYRRATWLQAPLAVLSCIAASVVWFFGGGLAWLIGALCIGMVVPFTFIVIMPTNHELLAPGRDLGSVETRQLLERWGILHGVRSIASTAAALIMQWALHRAA